MKLMVRVINKYDGADPETIAKNTERGDIIDVFDDSHEFGSLDLTNPDWMIINVVLPRAQGDALKVGQNPGAETRLSRIRAFGLDLDNLRTLGYAAFPTLAEAQATRAAYLAWAQLHGIGESEAKHLPQFARSIASITVTGAHLLASKATKAVVPDPGVIG